MNKIFISIAVVVLVILGAYVALTKKSQAPSVVDEMMSPSPMASESMMDEESMMNGSSHSADSMMEDTHMSNETVTVNYTDNGFEPNTVTIKQGQNVTWVNKTSGRMWVASSFHPTHTVYDGTSLSEHCSGGTSNSFDQCASGDSYTFNFDKVGTWNYHNHSNARFTGTVVVTQ